jgi:hypothetical protein
MLFWLPLSGAATAHEVMVVRWQQGVKRIVWPAARPRRDRALALSQEPAPTPPEGHPSWIIGWQWP